jgi:hypothetical protein
LTGREIEIHSLILLTLKVLGREAAISDVCEQPGERAFTATLNGTNVLIPRRQVAFVQALMAHSTPLPADQQPQYKKTEEPHAAKPE